MPTVAPPPRHQKQWACIEVSGLECLGDIEVEFTLEDEDPSVGEPATATIHTVQCMITVDGDLVDIGPWIKAHYQDKIIAHLLY